VRRTALVLGINLLVGASGLAYALHRFGRPALVLLGREPSPSLLAVFVVLLAAGFGCYAVRWRLLLEGLGPAPALGRLLAYRAAGQSLSALIPSAKLGGEPLRAYLLVRSGVPPPSALASVGVDRTLETGASIGFACLFAVVLLGQGVPQMQHALATVGLAAAGLGAGVLVTVRRLRRGAGAMVALVRITGLERLGFVHRRLEVLADADAAVAALVAEPGRLVRAFVTGLVADGLALLELHVLLRALALPSDGVATVAAMFATGAAHALPVPAGVGALEGGAMWLFGMLGYPPAVGLAVALAVRLRELVVVLPGLAYLVLTLGRRGATTAVAG
jgi:uncharacterized protein (TIRG00374 family)